MILKDLFNDFLDSITNLNVEKKAIHRDYRKIIYLTMNMVWLK